MGRQPGRQILWALEVEQCIGQGLQLLQRQGLDAAGGGGVQGSAAAVELAEGHGGGFGVAAASFAFCASFLAAAGFAFLAAAGYGFCRICLAAAGFAFRAAFCESVLREAGVAHVLAGNLGDLHQQAGRWVGGSERFAGATE